MNTKPRARSPYALWEFHLADGDRTLYQLHPQMYDPASHVVPYLEIVMQIAAGQDRIPVSALPATIDMVPGIKTGGIKYDLKRTDFAIRPDSNNTIDLVDVFAAYWWDVFTELRGPWAAATGRPPGYKWGVWYKAGTPVEYSFHQVEPDGTNDPMFSIPDRVGGRCSLERLAELLSAPSVVTNAITL